MEYVLQNSRRPRPQWLEVQAINSMSTDINLECGTRARPSGPSPAAKGPPKTTPPRRPAMHDHGRSGLPTPSSMYCSVCSNVQVVVENDHTMYIAAGPLHRCVVYKSLEFLFTGFARTFLSLCSKQRHYVPEYSWKLILHVACSLHSKQLGELAERPEQHCRNRTDRYLGHNSSN